MKNLFSLDWFKSQRQIELEELKNQEQELKNKLLEKQLGEPYLGPLKYKTLRLINSTLTVVLQDGTTFTKTEATAKDFENVKRATTEEQVIECFITRQEINKRDEKTVEYNRTVTISQGLEHLKTMTDFEVKEDSVFFKGINRTIPTLLLERFVQIAKTHNFQTTLSKDKEYISLKKFWLKCCLNPNAQSAEDLYTFLSHHQFKIDNHGNFYAYRRVVSKEETNVDLVDFVSNAYNKVKAVWKKKPSNYEVFDDNGYIIVESQKQNHGYNKHIGNLQDLYLDLPNMSENTYTSAHTGMEDYRVGTVISMPRHEGDDNNRISCSKGFHAASKEYDYSGFGDTPILVIINPMDVLSVPVGEVGKLRTCRWFFAMTLPENEEHILDDDDFDVSELGDIFEEACLQDLEQYVHNGFTEEVKRHTFTMPSVSNSYISNVVKSLEDMQNEIKNRVQQMV